MKDCILYIHGFNSSPLSTKALQTKRYVKNNFPSVEFICPQLASSPMAAINQLITIIEETSIPEKKRILLVGSSLGGYFASYLAAKYRCLMVLINPAIKPYELLVDYLGEQVNPFTKEVYQVSLEHIDELKCIEASAPSPNNPQKNNYLIMVQTGDEVLNYQQAVEKYRYCQLLVQEGGDHSFKNFAQVLPTISDFFQLT